MELANQFDPIPADDGPRLLVRNPEYRVIAMVVQLDAVCGLENVRVVHVNDSKAPLGSRKDRHEHIGAGEIGRDGFRCLLADPLFRDVPGYLETEKGDDPESGEPWDVINLRTLRELAPN